MLIDNFNNAVDDGNIGLVKALISQGMNVNSVNDLGVTPLMFAASNGDVAMVKLLLAHGANVNTDDGRGVTALTLAAYDNRLEVVKILIEAGANVNARNNMSGETVLRTALNQGHQTIAQLLRSYGASL